jgi:hypothetical protein
MRCLSYSLMALGLLLFWLAFVWWFLGRGG